MKINNNIIKLFLVFTVVLFNSCETIDLDQTVDPSGVSPDLLDPVYTFNYVQLRLPDFVESANSFTQRMTRQMAMTGGTTYDNAYAPINFDTNWSQGYNILNAVKIMEPKAIQNKEYYALGGAKVIRAYVLMTMVDMYGDIPLTEALQGNGNLTPRFDSSLSVYKQVLLDLDEAITILDTPNVAGSKVQDLYYTSAAAWKTLAKTLKLKMYLNARLAETDLGVNAATEIGAILSAGDYIDTPAEDFAFKYGNSRFTPNTRHPLYNDQYELGGGAYIANYMMWASTIEKGTTDTYTPVVIDPRTDFYFFKQDASLPTNDFFAIPNRIRPVHYNDVEYASFFNSTILTPNTTSNWIKSSVALPANGFLGRDHGDASGIPPDANLRSVAGVYPIGGAYGNAQDVQSSGSAGALGAGITPILMSSYVNFMKAEAILKLGVAGNAKTELLAGITASIKRSTQAVNDYPKLNVRPNPNAPAGPTNQTEQEKIDERTQLYIDFISTTYDGLSGDDQLELIIKEYYLAAWGNGIEPYNNYRRTGFPSNFQPTLEPASGSFYSTAFYPASAVNNNPNTPNNVRTRKVFWDKAAIVLH
ncbi:SusD/RagB family nutrient-binding outer membrane lipoprotein [Flavobacterium sp.]|uniref:SusD/RagB family nutrient-binding outer membrane lipoprotein n=1 Tax=Flavobacterium sp. TaxID=239 RepID=UPI00286C23CB|nr:SusD/RagB family nutrient-binding outer membrane lipoprotein [Flavobacterium sp.]